MAMASIWICKLSYVERVDSNHKFKYPQKVTIEVLSKFSTSHQFAGQYS